MRKPAVLTWLSIRNLRWFGVGGSLIILLGTVLSALLYSGNRGETYSFFNHFISELGEVGVSSLAVFFNVSLILAGIAFLVFNIGLGFFLSGFWFRAALFLGMVTAVFMSLVGVFPMNNLEPHKFVAMTFFRSGLLMLFVYGIAIFRQPAAKRIIPLWVNGFGGLAVISYAAFLVIIRQRAGEILLMLNPSSLVSRPDFWITPVLEWSIFFFTLFWFLGLAVGLRETKNSPI